MIGTSNGGIQLGQEKFSSKGLPSLQVFTSGIAQFSRKLTALLERLKGILRSIYDSPAANILITASNYMYIYHK